MSENQTAKNTGFEHYEIEPSPEPPKIPESSRPPRTPMRRRPMTEGVIWKQLLIFALPILVSNILQQLYSMVDLLIVGNYEGHLGMGAIASTGSITVMLMALFIGVSAGASVVVSQYYGADDTRGVHDAVHTALALSLITGTVLTVLGFFLTPSLLHAMDTPADIIDDAIAYMQVVFLGMLPTMVYNMGGAVLRAIGDSRNPLIYLVISAVMNLILDIIFVGYLGWGVAGAAWATFFAQILSAVLVIVTLMRSEDSYRYLWRETKIHGYVVRTILKIGVPAGAQSMVINLSNVIIQSQINGFGSMAVSGAGAAGRIDGFLYMTLNAFGLAVMTFVGQNHGAGRRDRVKSAGTTGLLMSAGSAIVLGIIVVLLRTPLVALFNTEPDVLYYGGLMILVLAPSYWILSAGEVYSGFLRGVGVGMYPMISSIICMSALRLAFIFIGRAIYDDIIIIYLSYPFSWAIQALSMIFYVKSGRWHRERAPHKA